MSVREDEQRKNNCSSRGLGLAAAAIGVGVGAALYYFFSKRPENPDQEGSTSESWRCQEAQALNDSIFEESEYSTISEHSTTDTSILDETDTAADGSNDSVVTVEDVSDFYEANNTPDLSDSFEDTMETTESETSDNYESYSESESDSSISETARDNSFDNRYVTLQTNSSTNNTVNAGADSLYPIIDLSRSNPVNDSVIPLNSDSDVADWDVTDSSVGVPTNEIIYTSRVQRIFDHLTTLISPNKRREEQQANLLRESRFRERSWSLEECSICFEVMLRDQELLKLPCTHNFHVACIGPWLQEQQTCPMCRKVAE